MALWRRVQPEDLSQLKDFLEQRLPYSILVQGFVEMMLQFDLGFANVRIYRATDPKLESVIAVFAPNSMDLYQPISIFCDDGKVSDQELAPLIISLPEVDWGKVVLFCGYPYITEKLRALFREGKLGRDLQLRMDDVGGLLHTLKGDIPSDTRLPEGMWLGSLNGSHTDLVRDNWRHGHTVSREDMKFRLENFPSAAVFVKDENSANGSKEGRPVAWTMTSTYGLITNTFTLPEYRRRGLASAVTLALARKTAVSGRVVWLVVEHYNEEAKRMHEKMGFKVEFPVSLDLYLPPGVTI